jgi:micrococcal nuclease
MMYEYRVKKVLKIVDGDTIDVDIDLGFSISYTQRVRLAGIDTPESRTKDKAEKALGLESKKYLADRLKDAKNIVIKTEKINSTEKFGRVLGHLFINGDDVSLNMELIDNGYAWPYMGDTKVKDFDALLAKRNGK